MGHRYFNIFPNSLNLHLAQFFEAGVFVMTKKFYFLFIFSCLVASQTLLAQCDFTISPSNPAANCQYAIEEVVWISATNLAITGNNVVKNAGGNNNFNAGALSTASVSNFGYIETTVNETNRDRAIGLSTTDGGVDRNSIDYAIQLRNNGQLRIYENGTEVENPGPYSTNDILRIEVDNNVVKYFQNGSLLRISNTVPVLPMIADISIDDLGGTLEDVVIANGTDGSFTTSESNPGTGASFQWFLNGSPVTIGTTYVNTGLSDGDIITAILTLGTGGCTTGTISSNQIVINDQNPLSYSSLFITTTPSAIACYEAREQAIFTDIVNIEANGNDLNKLQGGNNNFNAGSASLNTVSNNGYAETTVGETNLDRVFGLSSSNGGVDRATIEYGVQLRNNGNLRIYESGVEVANPGAYANGDIIRIAVEDNVVKYYQNGTLLRLSNTAPTLPMLVDVSIDDEGGTLNDIIISNGTNGDFNVTTDNLGASPTFQWRLNGTNVGTNSSSYSNSSLNDGDLVSLIVTPDLDNCSTISTTATEVEIRALPTPDFGDFYVANSPSASACKEAIEEVVFTNITNLEVIGNDLTKLQGGNNTFNAGAFSLNEVSNGGYVETVAAETNLDRVIGLSSVDGGIDRGSIQYGIQLRNNSLLRIYENGTEVENPGFYSTGDVLRIEVDNNVVKYFQNGNLLRLSNTAPTLPLMVDVSIDDVGGTLNDIVVSNGNTGIFNAVTTNAGANPTYQWKLNGGDVGSNSPTYTNTTLNDGDLVTVDITPDISGCSNITYTSNTVTIRDLSTPEFGDFYVSNSASASACKEAIEEVVFTDVINLAAAGNDLTKIQGGNNNFNAGAASLNTVSNNGYAETTVAETNLDRVFGLSTTNTGNDRTSIQYGVQLRNNGNLRIYENGIEVANPGAYSTSDVIRIAVENNVVKYYQNGSLLRISNTIPTLPLLVDVSIDDEGGTLNDIIVSNGNTGIFNAVTTNAGASPTYQWTLNGINVGTNSSSYTNTALNDTDVVSVQITPDLGGCSNVTYTANTVTIRDLPTPQFGDFYVENSAAASACKEAIEQVVFTDIINLDASGNDLTKLQGGNNSFNAGAASLNVVSNNGYAETTVAETNLDRVFGLSSSNGGVDRNSIDFAIQLRNNGNLRIYESGTEIANPGAYSTGDVIRIAVEDNVVKYYQNGTLLRISNTAPTLPLLVDVSIDDLAGTLNDIVVSNGNTGVFNAITSNAGTNPSYQWTLNGLDVGTNSPTYTSTTLNDADVVSVEIVPDLGGCSNVTYIANTVTIRDIAAPTFGTFYISNTPSTISSQPVAFEEITWTDIVNTEVSGSSVSKLQGGNNNYNAGAASLNTVVNNSLLQTIVTDTTFDKTLGLSTANLSDDRNSIEFGIELRNNRRLRVYESGVERSNPGTYDLGDTIKIAVLSNTIEYYRNSTLLYTSLVTPTLPLIADVSLNDTGAELSDVSIVSFTDGDFFATTTGVGANPSYQWFVNGVTVGSNLPAYSNAGLADQDIITLQITPDLGGCTTSTPYLSNEILIEDANSVLPVVLTFFEAEVTDNGVLLKWETSSEINNDYFKVEVSNDNLSFEEIGRVNGAGTTSITQNYQMTHNNFGVGTFYYRLTQVDFDGMSERFGIISVFKEADVEIPLSVYPNPNSRDFINIKGNLSLYNSFEILNSNGIVVKQEAVIKGTGQKVSVGELSSGIYLIRLRSQGAVETIRFIKN